MGKRVSYLKDNVIQLIKLCNELGYRCDKLSSYQYRVYGATHIIDIWPSRMVYHRVDGEILRNIEIYWRDKLDNKFNKKQVETLLATGEVK